jgi:hypothetical protein
MSQKKKPTSSDAKRKIDDKLDEALKDSFPSSDPVAFLEPAPDTPEDPARDKHRKSAPDISRSR